ncbi:MAG: imidazole glycerol phosphate synthase subunit HisF [Nitrososphaeria archaeon]|nr:imidazole glycerol phosphate synthase subunit HisF [Conexivisphaerales archaeon]
MLAKRIIPCLDVDRGTVVKGRFFTDLKEAGDPVKLAEVYRDSGADEIVFLDISASFEGRKIMIEKVKEVASKLDIPFTVGGGIASLEDARELLWNGADKVSINTYAVLKPELITEIADVYGSQSVVVSIDARRENDDYYVYIKGGRERTGLKAKDWAQRAVKLGAGELLITSIDRDGTKLGYDVQLTQMISKAVSVPVIASGGGGRPEHFFEIFTEGNADAALAASVFHFKEISIPDLKKYLRSMGVAVRI